MSLLFWFFSAQVMTSFAYLLSLLFSRHLRFSEKLRLHYRVLFSLAVILAAQVFIPVYSSYQPLQKVWTSSSESLQKKLSLVTHSVNANSDLSLAVRTQCFSASLFAHPDSLKLFLLIFLVTWAGIKFLRDIRALQKIKTGSFRIKKIGRVEILSSDQMPVPLTYWTLRGGTVIIPSSILSDPRNYRISVLHELQHQRQRDPIWMFGLETFKIFSFINPLAKLWIKKINELQEFACDEALIGRSKVSSSQYARCLLKVAESALHPINVPDCATGLLFRMERYPLKRRIQMLLSMKIENTVARSKLWPKLLVIAILIAGAAYTTKGIAESQSDRTITLDEAKNMSAQVKNAEGLPIVVNDAVLRELNLNLGSPAKRQILRDGIARMKDEYQTKVDSMLVSYQLPKVLDAMPLVESRYQNLTQANSMHSAGVWQFIPQTAREMGLTVNENQDERLNFDKLNQAAGRLIESSNLVFDNLGLAVLAFNWGDPRVNALINQTGSRDPWVLVHANRDDTYLPKVVAAAIIIANPKSVE